MLSLHMKCAAIEIFLFRLVNVNINVIVNVNVCHENSTLNILHVSVIKVW